MRRLRSWRWKTSTGGIFNLPMNRAPAYPVGNMPRLPSDVWTMGILFSLAAGCAGGAPPAGGGSPPSAPAHPKILERHGDRRVDDYYWLRERENPEVLTYLKAENAYAEAATAHTRPLQE